MTMNIIQLQDLLEYQDADGWNNHISKWRYQMKIDPMDFLYANLMMSIELRKKYDNAAQMDFIYYFEQNNTVYYFNR